MVERKDADPFVSFAQSKYLEREEGYKRVVAEDARKLLSIVDWKKAKIGEGQILAKFLGALQLHHELAGWRTVASLSKKWKALLDSTSSQEMIDVESKLVSIYHGKSDEQSFTAAMALGRKRFPVLAYIFFIKDPNRFLPLRPEHFEKAFALIGVTFKLQHRASWASYHEFTDLVAEVRGLLTSVMNVEVTLIDAHSFLWVLANQLQDEVDGDYGDAVAKLDEKSRSAVIQARLGQGIFRAQVLAHWSSCSCTGCSVTALLRASHIKPWRVCTVEESIDHHNGLLLSPSLDLCFDKGYISFTDQGELIRSSVLSEKEAATLGIHSNLKILGLKAEHLEYLAYHRAHIFRNE